MNGQRSGIPKVVGILMIVFASLGLLLQLLGLGGNASSDGEMPPAMKTWQTVSLILGVIGLGISGLHLFAGISGVRYKAGAPKLSILYGVLSIAHSLVYAILIYAWIKPALTAVSPMQAEAVGGVLVVMSIIFMIWPIIVLALMTRPGAKASCVN